VEYTPEKNCFTILRIRTKFFPEILASETRYKHLNPEQQGIWCVGVVFLLLVFLL